MAKQLGSRVAERQQVSCRLCGCTLGLGQDDDEEFEVCGACKRRPEARRLGPKLVVGVPGRQATGKAAPARAFTDAERSLIRKVHGYMQPVQLLGILNERLASDLGPDASPYSMEQLHGEIGEASQGSEGPRDWATLRQILGRARRSGTLARISEQTIQDFAVVYSLNAKQVMSLKDIILTAGGDEE